MIDSVLAHVETARAREPWREFGVEPGGYALVTLHRPALVDDPALLAETVDGLVTLAETCPVVFPVHPRTREQLAAAGHERRLADAGVLLSGPLGYLGVPRARGRGTLRRSPTPAACRRRRRRSVSAASRSAIRPSARSRSSSGRTRSSARGPSRIAEIPGKLETPKPGGPIPLWDGQAGDARRTACCSAFSRGAERPSRRLPDVRDRRRAQLQRQRLPGHRAVRHDDARDGRPPRAGRRRHVGRRRRPHRPRLPPPGDHRPLRRGDAADGQRGRLDPADLQRRDLQPRRDPRGAGVARRPHLAHRPLGHGDDRPRLRAVGDRLHPPLPRHVRAGDLGRALAGAVARARPDRDQAALLQRPPRPDRLRLRDQGAAPGSRPGAGGRRGVVLPLPLLPDDARAPDALPRDQQAAGRDVDADHRRRRDPRAALLGPARERRAAHGRAGSRDRRADPRRAAHLGAAAEGLRRAGRRLPLRRDRLEHERRALLRGRGGHGEDVLDRLRGRVRELQERAPLRAADGRARRRRAPRAAAHRRRPARLPAEDGAAPGRADRRPGLRPGLLRLEARARQRRHRRAGGRGRRRALLGLPGVEGLPQPPALRRPAGAVGPEARRGRRGDADGQGRAARGGVPAPRRRRSADLLGRRRGVHAHAEAAAALDPAAPRARRPQLLGRDRADPQALRRAGLGALAARLDELHGPEHAAARAAADARRQDEHGRQPRGARSRSSTTSSSSSPSRSPRT